MILSSLDNTCAEAPRAIVPSSVRSADAIDHLELPPLETGEKLFIIGDVHGCLFELQDLVAEAEQLVGMHSGLNEEESTGALQIRVILVGDLVNKGPCSAEVVRYVRERGWHCVMGNHDSLIVRNFHNFHEKEAWAWVEALTLEDKQWLSNLPYTISVPHVACVVHAGLLPGVPLCRQSPADMMNMRNVSAVTVDGRGESAGGATAAAPTQWQAHKDAKVGQPWAHVWDLACEDGAGGAAVGAVVPHVYFGHDAVRGLQLAKFATGLDTGCCYGRSLSGMLLPERRLIQVPARAVYEVAGAAKAKNP